jgi:hypothetical protein
MACSSKEFSQFRRQFADLQRVRLLVGGAHLDEDTVLWSQPFWVSTTPRQPSVPTGTRFRQKPFLTFCRKKRRAPWIALVSRH